MSARLRLVLTLVGALITTAACADERGPTSPPALAPTSARASHGGTTTTGTSTASAPVVASITLSPSNVVAGATSTGTITLSGPSPSGGTFVGISSNATSVATVSGSITIPAGDSVGTFTVTALPVATTASAAISATANQVTQTATLFVTPGGVTAAAVTIAPSSVTSGAQATGTVTLNGAAPAGGAVVALTSSAPAAAAVPTSLTIPEGATSGTFAITAGTVTTSTRVQISAAFGGVTQFGSLIVGPPAPSGQQVTALTITPNPVQGGDAAQATVTIASAGSTPTTVTLSTSDATVATVPASVTVPAGGTSATFAVATSSFTGNTSKFALITASANGTSQQVDLTTLPLPSGPAIASVVLFPSSIGGGGAATGRVTLQSIPPTGAAVQLVSSRPDLVQVPSVVFLGTTALSADFPITTSPTSVNTPVTITALSAGGAVGSVSATLTVTTAPPPAPDVVRVQDARWVQVNFKGGMLTVKASSSSPNAILTVFIPGLSSPLFVLTNKGGGSYEGTHAMESSPPTSVTVRSNLGGSSSLAVKQ